MKKQLLLFLAGIAFCTSCSNTPEKKGNTPAPVVMRIGWQIPWAVQGQLVQTLKHAGVLDTAVIKAEYKGYQFGAPLNEGALAGDVDVVLTADQPAATLIAKNPEWVIISRLMYNRVGIYVPMKSPVNDIAGLKNKKVGMPFGAAAQRAALKSEQEAGLDPASDVENINLAMNEQSDLAKDPEATMWGQFDAFAGFDPIPAILEEKKLARMLKTDKIVSVILMKKSYITANPDAVVSFLRSFDKAYNYYRENMEQVDNWYREESKLNLSPAVMALAYVYEPNLTNKSSAISLTLGDADIAIMQEAADFLHSKKMIASPVKMSEHIDLSYLNKALGK